MAETNAESKRQNTLRGTGKGMGRGPPPQPTGGHPRSTAPGFTGILQRGLLSLRWVLPFSHFANEDIEAQ